MLRAFHIPLTWTELVKRTVNEALADRVLGLAAELAYYFLLALVPAIVFIAALASYFPGETIDQTLRALAAIVPADVLTIVRDQLQKVAHGENGGILTFGLLMALWSSSAAIVSITEAMNRAYDIDEGRPWWKVRLVAIGVTVGLAVFVLAALTLVMVGPTLADRVAAQFGLGGAFATLWKVLQWPVAFALVAFALALLNYFAPDADQDWAWITPGAVLSTLLWLVASLAFKVYLAMFADYNATYGSLGGVIVLMLWFYISGLAILTGSEMNAEIEHASPHGKAPGEKVPGEKKKIGARAARAFEEAQRRKSAGEGRRPAAPAGEPPPRRSAAAYAILGMGAVIALVRKLAGPSDPAADRRV
jgi:membrane protein